MQSLSSPTSVLPLQETPRLYPVSQKRLRWQYRLCADHFSLSAVLATLLWLQVFPRAHYALQWLHHEFLDKTLYSTYPFRRKYLFYLRGHCSRNIPSIVKDDESFMSVFSNC